MVFRDPGDGQRRRFPAVVAGASSSPGPERGAFGRWRVAPVGDALGDHGDGDAGVEAGASGAVGPQRGRGRLEGPRPCGGDAGPPAVEPDGQEHTRRREQRGRDAGGDPDEHGPAAPIDHPRSCAPPGAFSPAKQRPCRVKSRPGAGNQPPSRLLLLPCPWKQQNASGSSNLALERASEASDPARR